MRFFFLFSLFFFFSSRRRHTRLVSDWSSDVCSSDLGQDGELLWTYTLDAGSEGMGKTTEVVSKMVVVDRSEERRVGKECRSRWSPYH